MSFRGTFPPFFFFFAPPIFAGHPIHARTPHAPHRTSHFYGRIRVCTMPVHGATRPKRVFSQVSVREGGRKNGNGKGRREGSGRFTTLGALDPNGGGGTRTRGRKNRRPAEKDEKNVKKNSGRHWCSTEHFHSNRSTVILSPCHANIRVFLYICPSFHG